jgi:putative Ca2+/H+ antiporter (TMEM165/GDT1 family)
MIWKAFGAAFGLTFVAEFGDKTQIAILTLAARYGWLPVFLGATVAFVVLNAIAVTAGAVIAKFIPEAVIRYVAAAIFIIFGLLSFRPEKEEKQEEADGGKGRGPFLTSLIVVALMELGDKTQLSLVALTSKYKAPFFVFLGGTIALIVTSFIGAIAGKGLSNVIPFKWIRWLSGVLFITFGILIALDVF